MAALPMRKEELDGLIDLYRMAAEVAFGWAEQRRATPEFEAPVGTQEETMQTYMEGLGAVRSNIPWLLQRPGDPRWPIALAFENPGQSARAWEMWGYKLTELHDTLTNIRKTRG